MIAKKMVLGSLNNEVYGSANRPHNDVDHYLCTPVKAKTDLLTYHSEGVDYSDHHDRGWYGDSSQ